MTSADPGRPGSQPRPVADTTPADWLVNAVSDTSEIRGLLPDRFEGYARILHPATTERGEPIPWGEVARRAGARMHRLAQFHEIAEASAGSGGRPGFSGPPDVGQPPPDVLAVLCDVLEGHTTKPHSCWFCLWEGWAWIDGSPAAGLIVTSGEHAGEALDVPPALPSEILRGPRVELPRRKYILFQGELRGALLMGWRPGELLATTDLGPPVDDFEPQAPNLFWPDDHAWCVASEIDFDSTYVGGSASLIRDLLDEPRLEVWPARADDPVSVEAI